MAEPTPNPYPLNIPEKQDSWERLQLLLNVPDEFKLSAAEFNKMVQALNWLKENLGSGSSTSLPGFETIYFGAGAYQNTAGNSTTPAEFAAHINSVGFTITENKLAIINITVKRQVDGQTVMAKERYYFKKNNTPGTWGSNSDNGEVSFSDFIFDSQTVVTLVYDYTVVRDLGDIGNNTIVDYVNNTLSPNQSLQSGNNYLFACVRSGVREIYEFKGTLPVTIGATSPDDDVEVQDFDLISNDASSSNNFVNTLQQVIAADPVATDVPVFKNGIVAGNTNTGAGIVWLLQGISGIIYDQNQSVYLTFLDHAFLLSNGTVQKLMSKILEFAGDWDVSSGAPTNANSYLSKILRVTAPGTFQSVDYKIGDYAIYRNGGWFKFIDNNQSGGASPIQTVVKLADENRVNTNVVTADSDLTLALEANSIYRVELFATYKSQGTPDFKSNFTIPLGATGKRTYNSNAPSEPTLDWTEEKIDFGYGNTIRVIRHNGTIITTNAGNLTFNWSQDVADASATTVFAGSMLKVIKLN